MSPALNPLRGASTAKTSRWLAIEMPRRQTASFRCDKMKLRSSGVPRLVNTCATDSTSLEKSIASSSGVPILERNAEPKLTNSCRKKLPSLQPRGHVRTSRFFCAQNPPNRILDLRPMSGKFAGTKYSRPYCILDRCLSLYWPCSHGNSWSNEADRGLCPLSYEGERDKILLW